MAKLTKKEYKKVFNEMLKHMKFQNESFKKLYTDYTSVLFEFYALQEENKQLNENLKKNINL
jgi:hypothetical protein